MKMDPFSELGEFAHFDSSRINFEQYLLRAIHQESPDGILVVDEKNTVVSHNRRFLEVWRIDLDSIQQGHNTTAVGTSDTPILSLVLQRTKDPASFLQRVQELYSDPNLVDHCEIAL